jgi:hypothetical protein
MSANLEDAIQERVHSLRDEQQQQVLEFVENLTSNANGQGEQKQIDLRERGISREQAADLRARLSTFAEDWNDPAMDVYDVD